MVTSINGAKAQKKPTNKQLEGRIKNALVHIDKDKSYKSVYFVDRGLRIETTDDFAVLSTNYHQHIFSRYSAADMFSRPYGYLSRLVEIAIENDCTTKDGYSFAKLMSVLNEKEDKTECNIVTIADWYIININAPLYRLRESEVGLTLTYLEYLFNISTNITIGEEKSKDMTNHQFVKSVLAKIKDGFKNQNEFVMFKKLTDEEIAKQIAEAEAADMAEAAVSQNEDSDGK